MSGAGVGGSGPGGGNRARLGLEGGRGRGQGGETGPGSERNPCGLAGIRAPCGLVWDQARGRSGTRPVRTGPGALGKLGLAFGPGCGCRASGRQGAGPRAQDRAYRA